MRHGQVAPNSAMSIGLYLPALSLGVVAIALIAICRLWRPLGPRETSTGNTDGGGRLPLANRLIDGVRALGKFAMPGQTDVYGELSLDGYDSKLLLHDVEGKYGPNSLPATLHGVIDTTIRISLLDCIPVKMDRSVDHDGKPSKYRLEVFPHHVLSGTIHIGEHDAIFTSIMFTLTDATTLFYDFDSFGLLPTNPDLIKSMFEELSKASGREITPGEHPEIAYFSGKHSIIEVSTELGKISAQNLPSMSFGSPKGVSITNAIWVELEFKSPRKFDEALTAAYGLEPLFSMIAGRPQRFEEMRLIAGSMAPAARIFDLYSTMRSSIRFLGKPPHPADLPIDPIQRPSEYSGVLTDWVKRAPMWADARARYSNSLRKEVFDIDRLVGSANMFDILPSDAVPKDIELPSDLVAARDQSQQLFQKLPNSAERSSILSALGRLGKSTLKQKVRWRASSIIALVGDKFPDLNWVLDEAVNCRNHYVHGTPSKVDYAANFQDTTSFFTKSLEFVFGASDLIDAGWDIKAWASRSSTLSHPFFEFRHSYKDNLAALKMLFGKQ